MSEFLLEDMGLHDRAEEPQYIYSAKHLPETGSLKNLDWDAQLYINYARAANYLEQVREDEGIPPNQVAQLMNTLTAILKEIVRLQTELYSAERVKKLEAAMIEAIKLAPVESQNSFFDAYEEILKG